LCDGKAAGLDGIKNGDLLRLAEAEFDLLITSDQNIRFQQNLAGSRLPILELSSNNIRRIRAATSVIQLTISGIRPGEFRRLEIA